MNRPAEWTFGRAPGDPVVLAHRGGKGPWRENTLDAFAAAFEQGADGVELDVRLTADGAAVVLHDASVEGAGQVRELTSRELPTWLPALEDALATCAGKLVNVEIKSSPLEAGDDHGERLSREVVAVLRAHLPRPRPNAEAGEKRSSPASLSGVVVSSFSPAALAATSEVARETEVRVPTGLLVHPASDPRVALEEAKSLGCAALHLFHSLATPDLVRLVHDSHMAVLAWTANSPAELRSVVEAGVDAIVTDDVVGATEVLGRPVGQKRGSRGERGTRGIRGELDERTRGRPRVRRTGWIGSRRPGRGKSGS